MTEPFGLFRVVDEYKGPQLKFVLSGAGSYVMRLLEVPGSGSLIDSIYVPYSPERVREYLMDNHPLPDFVLKDFSKVNAVSHIMCEWLHAANCANLDGSLPVTLTGAITSKKQRQGSNQAYVAVGLPSEYNVWHIQLSKLDDVDFDDTNKVESRRFVQDRIIGEVVLSLATGVESDLMNEMVSSGYINKV